MFFLFWREGHAHFKMVAIYCFEVISVYLLLIGFALCNLLYIALHTLPTGSFPKPLSPQEEQECLEAIKQGDQEAKNRLIEHNLRLVAHIIKR